MSPPAGTGSSKPQTLTSRIMGAFTGPASSGGSEDDQETPEILPASQRKAAMSTLNQQETKWALGGLILATVAGIAIPIYFISANKVTKAGKNSIAVAPDAKLLGGLILLFCISGFVVLWKRWRTPVVVGLFFIGFAFTLFVGLVGFVFILLGGWLMLRAWRINKYGTTDTKLIKQEVANRPRGKDARAAAPRSKSTSSEPGARKPPTASKRYTPKAPPRKKIPKTTQ
jgi:hypothetical protein